MSAEPVEGVELLDGQAVEVVGVIDSAGVHRPGLVPFDSSTAKVAAQRSADVRRSRRAVARAQSEAVAAELRRLVGSHVREDLGPVAAAAALDMIGRVSRGEVQVRDPADWVRVLVDIARLEAGEATSTSLVAHVSAGRVLELRDQARRALDAGPSAAAVAADDAGSSSAVDQGGGQLDSSG